MILSFAHFHDVILMNVFLLSIAKDRKTIFFSSHDVSKPDSGSYLSEVRKLNLKVNLYLLDKEMFFMSLEKGVEKSKLSVLLG